MEAKRWMHTSFATASASSGTGRDRLVQVVAVHRRHSEPDQHALGALAQIDRGDRVLDVAAGYGEPSLSAAGASSVAWGFAAGGWLRA